jgi:nucleoredoxin
MKFGGRIWFFVVGLALLAPLANGQDGPKTVVVTTAAKLEILRAGKTTGTVGLAEGTKLEVVAVEDEWVRVKFRSLEGRVAVAKTDFLQQVEAAQAKVMADEAAAVAKEIEQQAKPASGAKKTAAPAAATAAASVAVDAETATKPTTAIERVLAGKLVRLEGAALRPVAADRLARVKFYAIYFSAGWCPPCREFTPGFIDAYGKIREIYPEFETVFVSNDKSPAEMFAYMRDDRMTWPAVRWDQVRGLKEINRYAGSGIPCLVLVDADGKVLSDSYRLGRYVGPDAVLEDTWKLLKEYRRKNPRVKG